MYAKHILLKKRYIMNTIEAIKQRRAIKYFDPYHKLSKAEESQLMELAMLSPTAFNIQHWRFVLVKDPELRKQIRTVSWNQVQVTDASLLVILCADLKAWQKDPARYWQNAPKEVQEFMIPAISQYYSDKESVQRDEAIRSSGIAAQTLMLSAKAMGYDSCPMDGFDFEAVGKLINLPADHCIAMFVAVGKGIKEAMPRAGQIAMDEVVITDRF
jgi:nitroreductase